jgi:hypothetical protein
MLKLRPIMLLLAFALLVQNTCPFNSAGKSTVAALCEHCPMHNNHLVPTDGLERIASDSSGVHFPLYVFSLPKTIHTFQLEPIQTPRQAIADSYRDALPAQLLRPPKA